MVAELKDAFPSLQTAAVHLNLFGMDSIRAAAKEVHSLTEHIDVLINNAGVMSVQKRNLPNNGTENHFATNHIGHFLYTNLIMDLLRTSNFSHHILFDNSRSFLNYQRILPAFCKTWTSTLVLYAKMRSTTTRELLTSISTHLPGRERLDRLMFLQSILNTSLLLRPSSISQSLAYITRPSTFVTRALHPLHDTISACERKIYWGQAHGVER